MRKSGLLKLFTASLLIFIILTFPIVSFATDIPEEAKSKCWEAYEKCYNDMGYISWQANISCIAGYIFCLKYIEN